MGFLDMLFPQSPLPSENGAAQQQKPRGLMDMLGIDTNSTGFNIGAQMMANSMPTTEPFSMGRGIPEAIQNAQKMQLNQQVADQEAADRTKKEEREKLLRESLGGVMPSKYEAIAQADPDYALQLWKFDQEQANGGPAELQLYRAYINDEAKRGGIPLSLAEFLRTQKSGSPSGQPTDVQEYNFYAQQEVAAGQEPLGWVEYNQALKGGTGSRPAAVETYEYYRDQELAEGREPISIMEFQKEPGGFNVSQAAAAGYADRMVQSNALLSNAPLTEALMDRSQVIQSGTPLIGNNLVSPAFRQADQAKRDFINATLRRESGAVISPDEFANANLQYFPQPGDDANTLAQKKANRLNTINGVSRAAGPAYETPDTTNYLTGEPTAPLANDPELDVLVRKYDY